MRIAVTGATGELGRATIAALRARGGAEILALARSPERAADLDVPVRAFDYDRVETLAPALVGVDALLLISSNAVGSRVAQHGRAIDAARAAGVKRVAYTSILRADASPMRLAEEHRETEASLARSGLAWTALRNGWYTENRLAGLHHALAAGVMIGAAGTGRIASAARADYAEAAAAVLLDPSAARVYELAGDAAYTLAEYAAEVGRLADRPVRYENLAPEAYASALVAAGLPTELAELLADADACTASGALDDDGRVMSRLIGRPTTPWRETVAAAVAARP